MEGQLIKITVYHGEFGDLPRSDFMYGSANEVTMATLNNFDWPLEFSVIISISFRSLLPSPLKKQQMYLQTNLNE